MFFERILWSISWKGGAIVMNTTTLQNTWTHTHTTYTNRAMMMEVSGKARGSSGGTAAAQGLPVQVCWWDWGGGRNSGGGTGAVQDLPVYVCWWNWGGETRKHVVKEVCHHMTATLDTVLHRLWRRLQEQKKQKEIEWLETGRLPISNHSHSCPRQQCETN